MTESIPSFLSLILWIGFPHKKLLVWNEIIIVRLDVKKVSDKMEILAWLKLNIKKVLLLVNPA